MRLARTGETLMRRQSQRPAIDHRPVHQLDLFGLPDPVGLDQPIPLWRVLPEETRRLVTELMVRLLLDHGRADHRPALTKAGDDV
jgi:hypothetical protein